MRDPRELAKPARLFQEVNRAIKLAEAQQPRNVGKEEETGRRMDPGGGRQQQMEAFLSEENAVRSLRLSRLRENTKLRKRGL